MPTSVPLIRGAVALLLAVLTFSAQAPAVENLRILALFPDKVMVEVDGARRLLKKGERSEEGVLLISSDFEAAVIEVNGEQRTLKLSTRIGGGYTDGTPKSKEVRITMDASGSFVTKGAINGKDVQMLVDTGASLIAINSRQAKDLKLDYMNPKRKTQVMTAGGNSPAYQVQLDKVQVGGLELTDVPGVVLEGNDPPMVLLGMSFLSRVRMEHSGNTMVLRSR